MRPIVVAGLLFIATGATAKDQTGPIGFTCTASDGSTRRLNIDLRRGRYDVGEGTRRLSLVTDTIVTVEGPNPDLMSTPMGPVLHSLKLDRTTLVLTDETLIPDRSVNRTSKYQCATGPAIDFRSGRKF